MKLNIECTIIPDGVVVGDRSAEHISLTLRMSLMLRPHADRGTSGQLDWIGIANRLQFDVSIHDQLGQVVGKPIGGLTDVFERRDGSTNVSLTRARRAAFAKMFSDDQTEVSTGFRHLLTLEIDQAQDLSDDTNHLVRAAGIERDPLNVRFYSYGRIARDVRGVVSDEAGRSLVLHAAATDRRERLNFLRGVSRLFSGRAERREKLRALERELDQPDDPHARLFRWRRIGESFVPAMRRSDDRSLQSSREPLADRLALRQATAIKLGQALYGRPPGIVASVTAFLAGQSLPDAPWLALGFDNPPANAPNTRSGLAAFHDDLIAASTAVRSANSADGRDAQDLFDVAWQPASATFDKARSGERSLDTPVTETPIELLRRRFAEAGAHPTLMRFFGLMMDIEVPFKLDPSSVMALQESAGRLYGQLLVTPKLRGTVNDLPDFTAPPVAFVLDLEHEHPLFEPCPESEWPGRANAAAIADIYPFRDGFLDLRKEVQVGSPPAPARRYGLELLDTAAALNALRSQAQATLDSHAEGTPAEAIATSLPELRGGGIRLLDHGADVTFTTEHMKVVLADPTAIVFAEALSVGFRLDVVHSGAEPRAYAAGARELAYPLITKAYGIADPWWHPFPRFAERDDGYLLPTSKERDLPADQQRKGAPDKPGPLQFPSEVLVTWTGRNIGLPSAEVHLPPPAEGQACPVVPLPIEVHYRLPQSRLGPALRTGRRYRLMTRLRKVNGGSVPVARGARLINLYGLGDEPSGRPPADRPLHFRQLGKIAAPAVLIAAGDPFLTRDAALSPTESDKSLVLHQGRESRLRRILLAPRGTFEDCEQAGFFDGHPHRTDGMYQRLSLDRLTGSLPVAHRPGPKNARDVGYLYKISPPDRHCEKPFYVDPAGHSLAARLQREDGTLLDWLRPGALLPFWHDAPDESTVVPIVVEVESSGQAVSSLTTGHTELTGFGTVPLLRVRVAPADVLALKLWAYVDPAFADHRQILFDAQAVANKIAANLSVAVPSANVMSDAAARTPNDAFGYATTLKITHAVERPLSVPRFVFSGGRPLRLVRWQDENTWPRLVDDCLSTADPKPVNCVLPAEVTQSFVIGAVRVHRASTLAVRCEAAWLSYARDDARHPAGAHLVTPPLFAPEGEAMFEFVPKLVPGRLFDLTLPRRDADPDADLVDLLRDEAGTLRALKSGLEKDHKAHRVALRLVAASRFAESYVPRHSSDNRFEVASASDAEMIGVLDYVHGKPNLAAPTVWIDATARPAPPNITRVQTMLPFSVDSTPDGKEMRRRVTTRVHLGDDWFNSGEGEMLAVVCAPADVFDDERPHRVPEVGGRYPAASRHLTPEERWRRAKLRASDPNKDWAVSQWGADPTTLSEPLTVNVIPPETFANYAWKLANQSLWTKTKEGEPDREHKVALVCFEPRWDRALGEWFVDLDIDTGATKSPFVRLSLVRYQPHALFDANKDLRLSDPVLLRDMRIHSPCRVRAERQGDVLAVEIRAPTYRQRAPAAFALASPECAAQIVQNAQEPSYKVELALSIANGGARQLFGTEGQPLEILITEVEKDEAGTGGVWRTALPLPPLPDHARLVLTVEEQEVHLDSRAVLDPTFPGCGAEIGVVIRSPTPVTLRL